MNKEEGVCDERGFQFIGKGRYYEFMTGVEQKIWFRSRYRDGDGLETPKLV